MTDYVRSGSPTGPIVRRKGWSPDAPPQSNIAAVLVYRNRYMRVVWPDEAPPQLPRPAETYEVDISPHRLTLSVVLPTRDRREFLAEIDVEWRVVDPVAVVRRWVSDVRRIVSWPLEERARYISTNFRVDEIAEAEDLINQRLREVGWPGWRRQGGPPLTNADYLGAADGLWTRAQVRLTVPQRGKARYDDSPLYDDERLDSLSGARGPARGEASERQDQPMGRERADYADERVDLRYRSSAAGMLLPPSSRPVPWADDELREPEGLPRTTQSVTHDYDDVIGRAFSEQVKPGRLLFNPPDAMQLGRTARVEVRLTRTVLMDAELVEGLRGLGVPYVEDIPTSPLMAVALKGDGFKISAYSDEEQLVTRNQITTWEFDITALKRGQQRLVISVSLRIPLPGQAAEHKSVPVREATIEVQVGAAAAMEFVTANWQWFVGTAIAIGGLVTAIVVH
jgi:hypothetical protein